VGVDFLDVVLELEKLFDVRIEPDDMLPTWTSQKNDCTVGDLHEIVCRKCLASGVTVPRSSWNRVKIALVKKKASVYRLRRSQRTLGCGVI
jgi:hypothetical protein